MSTSIFNAATQCVAIIYNNIKISKRNKPRKNKTSNKI